MLQNTLTQSVSDPSEPVRARTWVDGQDYRTVPSPRCTANDTVSDYRRRRGDPPFVGRESLGFEHDLTGPLTRSESRGASDLGGVRWACGGLWDLRAGGPVRQDIPPDTIDLGVPFHGGLCGPPVCRLGGNETLGPRTPRPIAVSWIPSNRKLRIPLGLRPFSFGGFIPSVRLLSGPA